MRAYVRDLMRAQKVDALLSPTTLRKPPLIGGDDPGQALNCQLSAETGLPALSLPAGLSASGLPYGIELLAGAFEEQKHLDYAYDWEKQAGGREPPFSAPALSKGAGPAISKIATIVSDGKGRTALINLVYDPATAQLSLASIKYDGPESRDVIAVTLGQTLEDGSVGPLIWIIDGNSVAANSSIYLDSQARSNLRLGRLSIRLFTIHQPLGGYPAVVVLP